MQVFHLSLQIAKFYHEPTSLKYEVSRIDTILFLQKGEDIIS